MKIFILFWSKITLKLRLFNYFFILKLIYKIALK